VIANRIWLYHFGNGIVPTPNDFGRQGTPPTHPELLDWLATRLVDSGWSIKAMHRAIMLSRTYRLSSACDKTRIDAEIMAEKDPHNDLLSVYPRRRLDAEAIRDTLLWLGGNLDPTPGGAHPFPPQSEWTFTQHNPFKAVYDTNRRSVYLMTQRIQRHPYLAIFDGPDPSASTPLRVTSTTPLQALYLLNDPFVHEQAHGLANRLLAGRADNTERLVLAYRMVLGRKPTPEEVAMGLRFVEEAYNNLVDSAVAEAQLEIQSWQALMRVLFRQNEFVYIE
jgi:hypothetical protein